ncbi:cobalamin-binding protein [Aliifodinibius sp. S!AR15-10]|uniref:cobalamin-binding protein n=1 Tax=Aliifodinibius sp. S!AR15-10 TaxID=2950437 RepID=UPI002859A72F|nr:cobalamin-binding protein [Aliifodinibius sp. S!AR15-10]MDR8393049.1 cobalamin-binding protein [Aliifodinibius sp. S!AR15-10]
MRIVSLLPSITEIICALEMESHLVGRSHECDFPSSVQELPACTAPKYKGDGTSYEIDQQVKSLVQEGLSVYRVDAELLVSLEPDLILTQDHCEVCAASYTDVKRAVQETLDQDIDILSVSPSNLDEVLLSIQKIAEAVDREEEGTQLIKGMIMKWNNIQGKAANLPSPEVACIEWIDPLMSAGNWFPELVNIAGGNFKLGTPGDPSPWIGWEQVLAEDPDILLVSPCGYSISQTENEMQELTSKDEWNELQAVKNGRVFLMEGHHYFHRPGPRLVESAEILAEIFHPGIFEPKHRNTGWVNHSSI